MRQEKGRLVQLDGLRGIAILAVLAYHYLGIQLEAVDAGKLNVFEKVVMKLSSVGWCGVDLFFVLSGFLIGSILLKNRGSSNFFKTFYIRRFFRILPVYYILLIVFIICKQSAAYDERAFIFMNPFPLWYYFLLLQNFAMGFYKTFGPNSISVSWSLAVEEQFYLIIPFVIYYINPKHYKYIIIGGMLLAIMSRALLPNFYEHYTWLICRVDAPLTGFAVALLSKQQAFMDYMRARLKWLLALSCVFLVITLMGHAFTTLGFINHSLSALNFGIILLLVLFVEDGIFYKLLTSPFLLLMGRVSFFFYLFHQLVNGMAHLLILHQLMPMLDSVNSYLVTLGSFVLTLGAGVLSYKYFESRLIRYSHKFSY